MFNTEKKKFEIFYLFENFIFYEILELYLLYISGIGKVFRILSRIRFSSK